MKKKILSWKLYKEGISEMGFFFSVKKFIFVAAALIICVNLVALAYKLNLFSLIFLSLLSLICLPSIIKSRFIVIVVSFLDSATALTFLNLVVHAQLK